MVINHPPKGGRFSVLMGVGMLGDGWRNNKGKRGGMGETWGWGEWEKWGGGNGKSGEE